MSIHFDKPSYLLLLLILIPILVYVVLSSKSLLRLVKNYTASVNRHGDSIKTKIIIRLVCWSLAWVSACIALAGPSFGTELVPFQTSGSAVSLVFDVSYSMTATDSGEDITLTRLDHVKDFTHELIGFLPGVSLSAILTKGEGYLAVPMTEDYYSISNLIQALSPTMLSSPGSSLAKGLDAAIESFPPQTARSSYIIIFSDGDDTAEGLEQAVERATSFGAHVIFVGFGSEQEADVLAGDGSTRVKTALRTERLTSLAEHPNATFLLAGDETAIEAIINTIKPSIYYSNSATTTNYEMHSVRRHTFFLVLAVVFFIVGFFLYSFTPKNIKLFFKLKNVSLIFLVVNILLLSSCGGWTKDSKEVLEGSYYWAQQDYQKAAASFLEVTTRATYENNTELLQYGLFGLSATYLMQGETDASLLKINEMDPLVLEGLDFARWYNKGVIFHRHGEYENAAYCFKRALLIDNESLQAKINLELSMNENTAEQQQQAVQERIPASFQQNETGIDDAVFSLIQENEGNQWKNREVTPEKSSVIDY